MKTTLVVALLAILIASVVCAGPHEDWARDCASGLYVVKPLPLTTPLAELTKYRAIKVYSYTSKPGDQVDIVQPAGVYSELVMDGGVVRVKQCQNKALWIEALVPLPPTPVCDHKCPPATPCTHTCVPQKPCDHVCPTPKDGKDGADGVTTVVYIQEVRHEVKHVLGVSPGYTHNPPPQLAPMAPAGTHTTYFPGWFSGGVSYVEGSSWHISSSSASTGGDASAGSCSTSHGGTMSATNTSGSTSTASPQVTTTTTQNSALQQSQAGAMKQ